LKHSIKIQGALTPELQDEFSPVPAYARKQLMNALISVKNVLISGGSGDIPQILSEVNSAIEMLMHFEKEQYSGKHSRKIVGHSCAANTNGKGMVGGIRKWGSSS